jgi:hypothetical protein
VIRNLGRHMLWKPGFGVRLNVWTFARLGAYAVEKDWVLYLHIEIVSTTTIAAQKTPYQMLGFADSPMPELEEHGRRGEMHSASPRTPIPIWTIYTHHWYRGGSSRPGFFEVPRHP